MPRDRPRDVFYRLRKGVQTLGDPGLLQRAGGSYSPGFSSAATLQSLIVTGATTLFTLVVTSVTTLATLTVTGSTTLFSVVCDTLLAITSVTTALLVATLGKINTFQSDTIGVLTNPGTITSVISMCQNVGILNMFVTNASSVFGSYSNQTLTWNINTYGASISGNSTAGLITNYGNQNGKRNQINIKGTDLSLTDTSVITTIGNYNISSATPYPITSNTAIGYSVISTTIVGTSTVNQNFTTFYACNGLPKGVYVVTAIFGVNVGVAAWFQINLNTTALSGFQQARSTTQAANLTAITNTFTLIYVNNLSSCDFNITGRANTGSHALWQVGGLYVARIG